MNPAEKIIVALDTPELSRAEELLQQLSGTLTWFKIGKELFTAAGPKAVELVKKHGNKVFLDLKFHDIPNTVKGAVSSALNLGVDMVNIHASGGAKMMEAAAEAIAASTAAQKPLLLAVTVLTSIDDQALQQEIRVPFTAAEQVVHLAKLAKNAGCDGVVASPREITLIREATGNDFAIVTPGVRPDWAQKGDQKRTMTPRQAIMEQGADYVVIGRPITAADDPATAAQKILAELS